MKTINKKPAFLLVLALVLVSVQALYGGSENRRGTAGAMELLLPVGSRGSAMGSSLNAVAMGAEAIHWNPAGVVRTPGVEAMFSTMSYIADIRLNYFALSSSFGDFGSIGVSLRSLDFGEIPITTVNSPEGTSGTYSPSYITGGLTFSRAFTDRIYGGITAKLVSENVIRTSASGIAFDFGVQYGSSEVPIRLGIALKNLGPSMKFDGPDMEYFADIPGQDPGSRPRALRLPGAEFELPSTLEIGVGYDYKLADQHALVLSGDFLNNNFGSDEYRVGAEYNYDDRFFVRAGYAAAQNEDDNIYGPTFGVGVNVPVEGSRISFDYAYRQVEFFDANQWFTLRIGF